MNRSFSLQDTFQLRVKVKDRYRLETLVWVNVYTTVTSCLYASLVTLYMNRCPELY